jgi:pimeloyl-ACP methyl ester carboxylesterase
MKSKFTWHIMPLALVMFFLNCCFCYSQSHSSLSNPVAGLPKGSTWLSHINWKRVVNAESVPKLVDENNHIDSAILAQIMAGLSTAHGGVVYFPKGTYYLNFSLPLYNGVVVRGDEPENDDKGVDSLKNWPTKFIFPKLVTNAHFQVITGESITTFIPKIIFNAQPNAGIIGLVNVDINRASIIIACDKNQTVQRSQLAPAKYTDTNVLLAGLRVNNAVWLDASIPTKYQVANQHPDQRWPDKEKGSINITNVNSCLIANCTVNDAPNENFLQNDYILDDGMRLDGTQARFRFSDHPGIKISPASTTVALIKNRVFVNVGNEAIIAKTGNNIKEQSFIINDEPNKTINGYEAINKDYQLIYSGKIASASKQYESVFGEKLSYRIIPPVNYDSTKVYPLVVFFHDFWERGDDNKSQTRQFVWQLLTNGNDKKYPCFIIAPQLPVTELKWKCEGLDVETWTARLTKEIIDLETTRNKIDKNRIYVIGESLGGAGAIDLAVQFPKTFAALVPIGAFYRFTKNSARQIRDIPSWLFYGQNDERLSPVEKLNEKLALENAKAKVKYTEVPGFGHRCWNDLVEKQTDFLPWLFAQSQNSITGSR